MKTYPEIPEGPYCYRHTGESQPSGFPKTEACSHWSCIESEDGHCIRGRCNLLRIEDEDPQATSLLWDQCKLCGINDED